MRGRTGLQFDNTTAWPDNRRTLKLNSGNCENMNADDARREEITRAGRRIEGFLQGLSPADLARQSACEGWTVGDVVGHLIERGAPIPDQIERGLSGDISAPPDALDDPPLSEDQFRQDLDRRAVALRQDLGDGLLGEFARVNREFDRVLALVQPSDWDTLCYHRLRPETVRSKADIRIAELAMHEWDMRWAFDPDAKLAEDSLPGVVYASGRAVRRAFRPDPSRDGLVRYRFTLGVPNPSAVDVVLSPEGASFEIEAGGEPDLILVCGPATYAMVIFGRWKLRDVIADGRLIAEQVEDLIDALADGFVGG